MCSHIPYWTTAAMTFVPILFVLSVACFVQLHANDPQADPKAVVTSGKARFTVLTSYIIRMEYGIFTDAPTFVFLNRRLTVPPYKRSTDGDWLVITTDNVELRYLTSSTHSFDWTNLHVTAKLPNGKSVTWMPKPSVNQTNAGGNLLGTFRTLDGDSGNMTNNLDCYQNQRADLHCTLGLVSRDGYAIVDDTNAPQFDENRTWPWLANRAVPNPDSDACQIDENSRQACGYPGMSDLDCQGKGCCLSKEKNGSTSTCYYSLRGVRDLYFFGHGHNYESALGEFTLLAGKIPMPPRFALGVFYSRYWAFSDIGQKEIAMNYLTRRIPLDVLVTDMDWHITFYKEASEGKKDQAGQSIGWTGFTWDKHLFPDPVAFLDWCKANGLHNTLNLHPASGIQPWEEKYAEMATAMGIDPSTRKYVAFDPVNITFVTNWARIVLGERESEGIDFWWLDWQQGENWIQRPGVNPTFWLNYIFFTNPYHWTDAKRPMLLHRFGGLGNHRYQTGFSGDVVPTWDSLAFQVYFTITASNVLFGYWSHDIGGHIRPSPPEMYTRWIQWGAFSPMFRTHCTKDPSNFRDIWLYPPENYPIMRRFIVRRGALVPYLYTQARRAHDTGVSLVRPVYYSHPEDDESYGYRTEYFFGDSFFVSPVVGPVDNATGLAVKDVWFPSDDSYVDWTTGRVYRGSTTKSIACTLDEMPVFGRAGRVVPLRVDSFVDDALGQAEVVPDALKLVVFAGGDAATSGGGQLYEDDGKTTDYLMTNKFVWTNFSYAATNSSLSLTIGAAEGNFDGFPTARSYQIQFFGAWPAEDVNIGGKSVPYVPFAIEYDEDSWTYDGSTTSLLVNVVSKRPTNVALVVTVKPMFPHLTPLLGDGFPGIFGRLFAIKELLDDQWDSDRVYQEDYFSLLTATETGQRITDNYHTAHDELNGFAGMLASGIAEVKNLEKLNNATKAMIIAQLSAF